MGFYSPATLVKDARRHGVDAAGLRGAIGMELRGGVGRSGPAGVLCGEWIARRNMPRNSLGNAAQPFRFAR